jgi:predicted small secreted protein
MRSSKKLLVVCLLLATLSAGLHSGCNTAQGFGRDMDRAGGKIQEKASR